MSCKLTTAIFSEWDFERCRHFWGGGGGGERGGCRWLYIKFDKNFIVHVISLQLHALKLSKQPNCSIVCSYTAGNTHIHNICTCIYNIDECYSSSDHGQSYTGELATTQGGKHCQSWDEPHLLFHPHLYSELDDAANLCRNPGQLKDRIWCFISESAWDYCSIPTNCSK